MTKKHIFLIGIVFLSLIVQVGAHEAGTETKVDTDFITITVVILSSLLASMVPLVLGFLSYNVIKKQEILSQDNYIIPLGLCLAFILFFLFDYTSLSSLFAFQISTVVFQTIKIFIAIITLIVLSVFSNKQKEGSSTYYFLIWALAIFIHTIGEGIIMGYNLTLGIATAFEIFSITSYIMHKFAEGVIGAVFYILSDRRDNILLYKTAIFSGLSILPGALLGYLSSVLGIGNFLSILNILVYTISFAIIAYLIPAIVPKKENMNEGKYFIAVSIGLYFMFLGVILHSI